MAVVNAKTFTCASCQKMITYGPQQAGEEIVCPRCGEKAMLPPAEGGAPAALAARPRKRRGASCLLAGCGGCLSVTLLLLLAAAFGLFKLATIGHLPEQLQLLLSPLASRGLVTATAPAAVAYAHSDIAISVTRMAKDCPLIYQASLQQSSATETPVLCVTVKITNNGDEPAFYRSWRDLVDEGDINHAATLQDDKGELRGLVSFGPGTWPLGAQRQAEIPPGASVNDLLLFLCGDGDAAGDYLLTLPGSNLGRAGELRFRIPREMVQ